MTTRKTVPISDLIESVNRRLETKDSTLRLTDLTVEQAFRLAACSLLEEVLLTTDTYGGFSYQASEILSETGRLRPYYDSTRRVYHKKGGL